ncbi:MAG: hypothetical protein V8Q09_05780 [Adlercreutzia sp.]
MDENSNIPGASGAPEPQQPAPSPRPRRRSRCSRSCRPENPFAAFGASASQLSACARGALRSGASRGRAAGVCGDGADAALLRRRGGTAAQQPYAPYGQAAGAGQSYAYTQATAQQPTYAPYDGAGYGSYGAGNQPPVPPAPAQNIYPGYEPPNPNQKRRWPWFLLGLAVGLVIGMGGCASCVGIMALADYDSSYDSYNSYDDGYDYNYDYDFGDTDMWAPEDSYGTDEDASPYGSFTFDEIASVFEADGVSAGEPGEGDVCTKGFYTVGPAGQIPAGLYYLEGSNEKLSHYYVFDGDDGRYSVDDSVQYFGNYFVDLDEGDLIVFDPGDEATMYPAPSTFTDPTAPYTNGCYRVGIDIPAGSYTITAATVGEGETDEDSAAFVMKNLDFDDDSIVDTKYVIPGGEQTVTVSNGQYLELFAATATPVAQG